MTRVEFKPATYARSAWIFRRLSGLIYLCAFGSLAVQITGLIGTNGILPAQDYMDAARDWAAAEGVGVGRFHALPTLFWFSASDAVLRVVCIIGVAASVLLMAGIAPLATLVVSWTAYLSLSAVGQDFLSFQWDALLLETGFFALFLAPARLVDRPRDAPNPLRPAVWLMLWLLFRLMIASGAVKLTSGDPTWADLTALTYHFETQPLPTPLAWYAHHLPRWLLKASTASAVALELFAPLLMLGGRPLRAVAFVLLVGLQATLALTGNYASFNLLTAALCVFLLDDRALASLKALRPISTSVARQPGTGAPKRAALHMLSTAFVLAASAFTLPASFLAFTLALNIRPPGWQLLVPVAEVVAPFRIANSYGLFAVMTTTRPEIIVEGSMDGVDWQAYEFEYKPGDLNRPPRWVAPHQPRLDWQMWFAALGRYETETWIRRFFDRLLQGSPEVLHLLAHDPFDGRPPRFIRGRLMQYRFSEAGPAWWTAEPLGDYSPVVTVGLPPRLGDFNLAPGP